MQATGEAGQGLGCSPDGDEKSFGEPAAAAWSDEEAAAGSDEEGGEVHPAQDERVEQAERALSRLSGLYRSILHRPSGAGCDAAGCYFAGRPSGLAGYPIPPET